MTQTKAEQQSAKQREGKLTLSIIIILIVGFSGLCVVFFFSYWHRQRLDGKLQSALIYSHSQKECASVKVRFEGTQVKVYFPVGSFKLRDDFVVPQGGFVALTLDDQEIENPKRIRLVDLQRNVFVLL